MEIQESQTAAAARGDKVIHKMKSKAVGVAQDVNARAKNSSNRTNTRQRMEPKGWGA